VTSSKQESLGGQEQQRTSTACQETVAQASSVAEHAGCSQATQDASTAATVRAGWIRTGSRLQEGDEEVGEESDPEENDDKSATDEPEKKSKEETLSPDQNEASLEELEAEVPSADEPVVESTE